MHARPGIILVGLGHEASGDAMEPRMHAHQALEAHQVIGRPHHIGAVMQRELVLARREFRDQCLGLDARRGGTGIDVVEKRQHPVELVHRIDIGLGVAAPVEHVARGNHLAVGIALVLQEEELELEGTRRIKSLGRQRIDLPLQGMARIRGHRRPVKVIDAHQHLAARRRRAGQCDQRAGDRPGATVAIALVPDQAGFMHILAADVEAEDRDRQVAAAAIHRQKLVPTDDLAPPDPVGVMQDDVEGLDLGMPGQEVFGLGDGRAGGAGLVGHEHVNRTVRQESRRRRQSGGRSAASSSPG